MRLLKKIVKLLFMFLLTVILLFNLYSIYQRKFNNQQFPMVCGYGYAIVISDSMNPSLKWGDLIIVHQEKQYKKNDIITFLQANDHYPTTHRIVSKQNKIVITKGDANNTEDDPIQENQIFGKIVLTIPFVGYFIHSIRSPLGILIVLLLFVGNIYYSGKNYVKRKHI